MHGEKRGQAKRSKPSKQARHWFAEAFLSLVKAKSKDPALSIAIGLPKIEPYPSLWKEIKWVATRIDLGSYFVPENGEVEYEQDE